MQARLGGRSPQIGTRRSPSPTRANQQVVQEQGTNETEAVDNHANSPVEPQVGVILRSGEILNSNTTWRMGRSFALHMGTHRELLQEARRNAAVTLANSHASDATLGLIYANSHIDPTNSRNNRVAGNRLRVDTASNITAVVTPNNLIVTSFTHNDPVGYIERNQRDDAARGQGTS